MAIAADALIDFFGTQDPVTAGGGTSAVTNGSFSASGDAASWTNDDDARQAGFVLKFQYPSGTIVEDGVELYARLMNVDSTNDEPQPDAGWSPHYLGKFTTDTNQAATTDTYYVLDQGTTFLPNQYASQVYEFYIKNNTDVTMTAGWTLKITPLTGGPHA